MTDNTADVYGTGWLVRVCALPPFNPSGVLKTSFLLMDPWKKHLSEGSNLLLHGPKHIHELVGLELELFH